MLKIIRNIFILLVAVLVFPAISLAATPLHNLTPGTIITFSGNQWMILDQMADGTTYIILNSNDGNRIFDSDTTQSFNPADSNNIGYYLNETFYNSLSQKDLIEDHSWDRNFQDGSLGSQAITCKIALISYAEYNTYRSLFPANGTGYSWWTRTPYSGYSYSLWIVNSNGNLSVSGANSSWGVRPALYLKSGLLLSDTNEVVASDNIPPQAPAGLTAAATSFSQVQLTWQANTEQDLAGYIIYRDYVEIARVGAGQTSYTDSGLTPNTTYTYGIMAYDTSNNESGMSNAATVTTPTPPAPSGLTVSNVTSAGARVSWNAVAGAESYNIYLNSTPVYNTTGLQYDFTGLTPGTTYTVEVRTVVSGVESDPATATFITAPPPAAPVGLAATALSYNQVQLTWQANTVPDLAGYIIYRDYIEVARVGAAETSYVDSGLMPDTNYIYGIKAYNTSNSESDISNAATVRTMKPPVPVGLVVSDVTPTSAKATWNAVSGANSYNIYLDGNPVYNTTQTQYDITGLVPGTNHTVEVRTVISGVESDPANASFNTVPPPAVPADLTATATAYNQVQITWQANTEPDLAGYIIYRDYVEIARVGAGQTSYTDSGLTPDTTYTYGIMAYNTALLTSGMSNAATVRTQALPKPVLTVRVDNRNISISWTGTADNFLVMVNDQQIASTTGNQYAYYAQPGSYKVQVIAVTGEYQRASDVASVKVSQIMMPGGGTMAGDILNNAGKVLYPAGGLLALALALKASPWIVAAVKVRKFF